ncbi:MAG: class I fructose-bisphosphate aldolase [Rickettsiaceae bacterium]|nr:class I fructose-bisphosphate aldolase [Rickettsiaceae bacterium]
MTKKIEDILSNYHEKPSIIKNLFNILMHGKLGGTGKILILPVDQGFEHGPDRSFAKNPIGYDPTYHIEFAIEAGFSAYAAPIGMLSSVHPNILAQIPIILKVNSNNSLASKNDEPEQIITSSVQDAVDLGCAGIGITIYPGSFNAKSMFEDAQIMIRKAKDAGLITVIWSYPRGGDLSKNGENAIDVCAYAAHIAALLGAHIIKVKPPTEHIEFNENKTILAGQKNKLENLSSRVSHVVKSCFAGKRLVVFSGGASKDENELLKEIEDIKNGGASGSIVGRNIFQRSKQDALILVNKICEIYASKK